MFNSHLKKTHSSAQSVTNLSDQAQMSQLSNKFAKLGSDPKPNPLAIISHEQKTALAKGNNSKEETKEGSSVQSKFNFATYLEPGTGSQMTAAKSSQFTMINTVGPQKNPTSQSAQPKPLRGANPQARGSQQQQQQRQISSQDKAMLHPNGLVQKVKSIQA